jgi:glutamine synthetase
MIRIETRYIQMVKIKAEYIWLDSKNNFRSKMKIIKIEKNAKPNLETFPIWNYDGTSTGQVTDGKNSELLLIPYNFYYVDNNLIKNTYIVFCNIGSKNDNNNINHISNRQKLLDTFKNVEDNELMFGFEQEFFILNPETNLPIGLNIENNFLTSFYSNTKKYIETGDYKNSYYCGIGAGNINKDIRDFMNKVMDTLIELKVGVTGMNMEVTPGQAEFQICNYGIKASDELILLRYLLVRYGEYYNFKISFEPKLDNIPKYYNGSGCHINFSSSDMRGYNGYEYIMNALEKLSPSMIDGELDFILPYGDYPNLERLSGNNETSHYSTFSYGVGDRSKSIRIPTDTFNYKRGYFEDRRPGSNIDPYVASCYLIKKIYN